MKFHFNEGNGLLIDLIFEKGENIKSAFFNGKKGEVLPDESNNKILLGLGEKDKFDFEALRLASYKLGRFLSNKEIKNIVFSSINNSKLEDKTFILSIVEGLILSSYSFDFYKEEKDKFNLENVYFDLNFSNIDSSILNDIKEIETILESQFLARDLVNKRANHIYPETLANITIEELTKNKVEVKVYGREEIEELGLKAFLEVSKGSTKDPKFIVMEYKNAGDNKPLVYVGKGLTYDSGGYSVKPTSGMFTMNSDMGGAGTVIGAMKAISQMELKVNVIGIVAACENMISGGAYKPGDIIDTLAGKKIEIDNTDAEGRVTLADAVYYGSDKYEPAVLIDLATLTGACLVALGERYTGVVTNSDTAFNALQKAADISNEKIWKLPNDDSFKELYKSDVADFKNSGGRLGGTITAGQFVGEFTKDVDWIHMDIAGTAYLSTDFDCFPKGATGIHVKTLYNFAKNYSNEK